MTRLDDLEVAMEAENSPDEYSLLAAEWADLDATGEVARTRATRRAERVLEPTRGKLEALKAAGTEAATAESRDNAVKEWTAEHVEDVHLLAAQVADVETRLPLVDIKTPELIEKAHTSRLDVERYEAERAEAVRRFGENSLHARDAAAAKEAAHRQALAFEIETKERTRDAQAFEALALHDARVAERESADEWRAFHAKRLDLIRNDVQAGRRDEWELVRAKAEAQEPVPDNVLDEKRREVAERSASQRQWFEWRVWLTEGE